MASIEAEKAISQMGYVFWKLAQFGNGPTNYNVIDAIGSYDNRTPKIRCEMMLDRCGMLNGLDQAKLARPNNTFDYFSAMQVGLRSVVPKLFNEASFTTQLTAVLKTIEHGNIDQLQKSAEMAALQGKLHDVRRWAEHIAANSKTTLDNLSKPDSDFCSLEWMKQLEAAKNKRLEDADKAIQAFASRLDSMAQPSSAPNDISDDGYIRYRTDDTFHLQHGEKVTYTSRSTVDRCKCQVIANPSKWLWAAWNKERPTIDGRGPDQKFCVHTTDHESDRPTTQQRGLAELVDVFRTGFNWRETLDHLRVIWKDNEINWQYNGYRDPPLWSKGDGGARHQRVLVAQLSNGLFYEWESKAIINSQWEIVKRAIPFLERVAATRKEILGAMQDVHRRVTEFAALAVEIDDRVGDILNLKLHMGSGFLIREIMHEMARNLTKMVNIWKDLSTVTAESAKVKYTKKLSNTFDYFREYHIIVGQTSPPFQWKWEPPQHTDYLWRTVPFPFPRQQPAMVLCGLTGLDYGTNQGIRVDVRDGYYTTTCFGSGIGDAQLRDVTSCHGLGVGWTDIPAAQKHLVHQGTIQIVEPGPVMKEEIKDVPAHFKGTDSKLLPSTKMACWFGAFHLEKNKDINIGMAANGTTSVDFTRSAATHLEWVGGRYFMWQDTPEYPIFCKTFKTPVWENGKKVHIEEISFGGKFQSPPKVFYALTALHSDIAHNLRLWTELKELTKDKAVLQIHTWDDSAIWSVGFVFIALPDTY